MADQFVDFEPPQMSSSEQSDVSSAVGRMASLNARAVLPSGREVTRGEILGMLGLDPGTSPTAWLTILGCGSNASALKADDLQRVGLNKIAAVSRAISDTQGTGASTGLAGSGSSFANIGTMRDTDT